MVVTGRAVARALSRRTRARRPATLPVAVAASLAFVVGLLAPVTATAGAPPGVPLPDGALAAVGDLTPVHDPALVVEGDTWHVLGTGRVDRENGGTIQHWVSRDAGVTWNYARTIWPSVPTWLDQRISGLENLWAPEVVEHDGTYYLYYSASRFGTNTSVTALATNTTLDPADPAYRWVDQGEVISSPQSGLPGGMAFNAIDAGVVDVDGRPWMAIGSFWHGIFLVELSWPSGKPVPSWRTTARHLAAGRPDGNAVEAPYLYARDGWYYLFVSEGACCRGTDSTYRISVGRSRDVTGPYVDRNGRDLVAGGGSVLLERHGVQAGPGGQSVSQDVLAYHYYATNDGGTPTLGLQKLRWVEGWPVADTRAAAATVTAQPADGSVGLGGTTTLTLGASGSPAPVAVWQTSADGGRTWQYAGNQRVVDGRSTHVLRDVRVETQVRAYLVNATGTVLTRAARVRPSPTSMPSPTPSPTSSVTPSPTPSPTVEPSPTLPAAATCAVAYAATSWGDGFTASVRLTNTGSAPLTWTLTFDLADGQRVAQGWSATWAQTGTTVRASGASWNATLAPGATADIGFNGTHTGSTPAPTSFTVAGTPCTSA
ncbi:cellulose-binding family II [Cellulomonas flavigena DSM 20109]|uniref:Cellulose-binding family II n=1 Tax=Cellulomonas flavigena (strain ATCC 482 / DSM 20109 / BCRC 11376 / JCM 18109 / NBRC 3775 / NCIMB 8073 / NRS 134) TaxID=446466 RepID=D5UGB5_CELFN|nr:family 43 glycosylhydrolase [Cellulomonas flavigena]ADG73098.1 cellulose-binding family II [Cellulomonas flavigena DSM 20109]